MSQAENESSEPAADAPSRAYRVLSYPDGIGKPLGELGNPRDHGTFPGSSPEVAIKRAESKYSSLKKAGLPVVSIAESNYRILFRTVALVESVSYSPEAPELEQAPADPGGDDK